MVPPDLKRELRPAMTEEEEDCYDLTGFIDPVEQDVFIFKLEDCALKALISVRACVLYMYCRSGSKVEMS